MLNTGTIFAIKKKKNWSCLSITIRLYLANRLHEELSALQEAGLDSLKAAAVVGLPAVQIGALAAAGQAGGSSH